MNEPRLKESVVAEIAAQFIRAHYPTIETQFSSAKYFTTDHHYAPLRKHWLAYFNVVEPGVLASCPGITVRIDDETGTPRNTHDDSNT